MSSCPRAEYPRPDLVRAKWQNLNGRWQFCLDPGLSGVSRGLANPGTNLPQEIVVPFCPESRLSGIANTDFMGGVWYRRTFTIPEDWSGKRIILHFGAVDYLAHVWVNGKLLGSHRGGYSPFSFDMTDALGAGTNVLTVFAEDDTRSPLQPSGKQSIRYESHGCHYTRTTGIWQTVWMEPVPDAHVTGLRFVPDLHQAKVLVNPRF
ncbi:MAG TPA: beta galactosidase jelly roll domain-containing protein [Candidatus Latescibacteria bacterium]|mgnify:FL=1|nr:beta galactosidase jelly roll domain-containing protein [Candidatus Latescibacterota bacterium]